jgi:prepilin-type N-terminal cleavage/methylation domain-containing protein
MHSIKKTKFNLGDISEKNPNAFTLVELIVVITILVILGTIGFISLQGYSSKSRDSTRATNLSLAARSLETYQVNASRYPSPESITGTGQIGGVTVALTGVFGNTVAPLVKLDKAPKDPLSTNYLAYGVDINNKQYQVAVTLEGTLAYERPNTDSLLLASVQETLQETLVPTAHAAGTQSARVVGNYQGVIRVVNGIYNTPSLIFFSGGTFTPSPTPIDLTSTTTRLVTNNGTNIPYALQGTTQGTTTPPQSLAAVGSTATSLTGVTITDWSTQSGTLATTLGVSKDTIGTVYYGTQEYAKILAGGGSGGGGSSPTDWRSVDTNCTKPDVVIETQTWAGCNSTIGSLAQQYDQANCYNYA